MSINKTKYLFVRLLLYNPSVVGKVSKNVIAVGINAKTTYASAIKTMSSATVTAMAASSAQTNNFWFYTVKSSF